MPIATGLALGLAGISAAGSIGGAAIAAHGANKAASTQATAANTAAGVERQDAVDALNFQKQQFNTQQSELAPWLQSGQSALSSLDYLLGIGPNGATAPPNGAPAPSNGAPGTAGPAEATPQQPNRNISAPGAAGPARPVAPVQSPTNLASARVAGPGASKLDIPGIGTGGIQAGPSALSALQSPTAPGVPAGPNAAPTGTMPASAPGTVPPGYTGQSFSGLVNSGDPNVSPNQQTTQQWKAQGIPFQNITTTDGRTVSVRTDQGGGPQASQAPPQGVQSSLASLANPSLGAFGSLSKGWDQTFQAPNNITEQNDPGFQARLDMGETALNNSAAARGGLLTGGTARDVNQFAQDYASNEYGNVYNRAFNDYATQYNQFQQNQTNKYNQLASLAGIGQQTASQLGTLGQNNANNVSNTLLTSGAQQGQQINNAGAATASGYAAGGNIWGNTVSNLGNLGQYALLLSQMNKSPNYGQIANSVSG